MHPRVRCELLTHNLRKWVLLFERSNTNHVKSFEPGLEQGPCIRQFNYTFVSHQQEVGAGYFDDVTTVIQGGASSVTALAGSTEEEQFERSHAAEPA